MLRVAIPHLSAALLAIGAMPAPARTEPSSVPARIERTGALRTPSEPDFVSCADADSDFERREVGCPLDGGSGTPREPSPD